MLPQFEYIYIYLFIYKLYYIQEGLRKNYITDLTCRQQAFFFFFFLIQQTELSIVQ